MFGLFSGALLLSAVLGPSVGRAIDNRGGRGVLALSNLVLAAGLVLLGVAQGLFALSLAWAVLGVGMAMGLYDPAFATLTGLYGRAARGPITGITLIAGFASTVGWPLSAFLDAQFGWRAACFIWAALHIVVGLPLNRLLIPRAPPPVRAAKGTVPLAIFGPAGYGLRSGILGAPARATQAASPLLFGLLMDHMGIGVLAMSAGLSLSAFVALLLLKARPAAVAVAA